MASGSKKVVYAALIGNFVIAATKFVAAAYTGSSAMLSEGVHSLVDTGNEVLLLFGLRRARKSPDALHPFGYGMEIYFWSFAVALLLFTLGAGVSGYEGVQHILHPPSRMEDPLVNYIVLGIAALFEGGSWTVAIGEFRRNQRGRTWVDAVRRGKDPTKFIVLFEDTAALAGIAVAFLGVFLSHLTGNPVYDGAASIGIACILAIAALWLLRETRGLLIGESAGREVVNGIREIARKHAEVGGVEEILTLHVGPEFIIAAVSVELDCDVPRGRAHELLDAMDGEVKSAYPNVKRVFIEVRNRCI